MASHRSFRLPFLLFCLLFPGVRATAQNAYLQDLSIGNYVNTNTDHAISVGIRNSTNVAIDQYRIGWSWNNGRANAAPAQRLAGAGIIANSMVSFTHPVKLNIPREGPGVLKVWVDVVGDRDHTNDTLVKVLRAIQKGVAKTVLLEMKTSSGCSYCPKANAMTNTWDADPLIAIAKFHVEDEFTVPSGVDYFKRYTLEASTPTGMIDQGEYQNYKANTQYSQWEGQLGTRKQGISPVAITLRPTFDPATRELCVEMTSSFTYAEPGEYVINALIIEDRIKGSQANAPDGVPHDQAVRLVLGGTSGTFGVIPKEPIVERPYSFTYSHILPRGWDPANVRVIGLVTRRERGKELTLNAAKSRSILREMKVP